ncbi:MAG: substrate-binding domain-containing protein [Pseudomonadota bacterium]
MTLAWGKALAAPTLAAFVGIAAFTLAASHAHAAGAEAVDRSSLRVCADPHNLPFSDKSGNGYENKIAQLLGEKLGVPVRYTWFPQTIGFVRNTLRARRCDLVIGVPLGFELLQNTNPYYRTTYVLVYRADSGLDITTLDDPRLKGLRLGVVAGTPPSSILARNGLMANTKPYQLMVDTRYFKPGKDMVEDVVSGEVDVGVLWGPIAGHYSKPHSDKVVLVPLVSQPDDVKMDYRITMGVRFNEPEWKREINALLDANKAEIQAILLDYGVPLLDGQGNAITH